MTDAEEATLLSQFLQFNSESNNNNNNNNIKRINIETQKQEIYTFFKQVQERAQKWCIIHISWYNRWQRYVGYDSWDKSRAGEEVAYPGPIDNTALIENGKLIRHLENQIHYQLVPELAWNKLLSWYGISEGSMKIIRQVVEYGKYVKHCKVEIYPLELKCFLYPNQKDFFIVLLSSYDTMRTLVNKIRKVYNIDSKKQTQIHSRYMTSTYQLIRDLNQEAQDFGLFSGDHVLLEIQNEDGTWP